MNKKEELKNVMLFLMVLILGLGLLEGIFKQTASLIVFTATILFITILLKAWEGKKNGTKKDKDTRRTIRRTKRLQDELQIQHNGTGSNRIPNNPGSNNNSNMDRSKMGTTTNRNPSSIVHVGHEQETKKEDSSGKKRNRRWTRMKIEDKYMIGAVIFLTIAFFIALIIAESVSNKEKENLREIAYTFCELTNNETEIINTQTKIINKGYGEELLTTTLDYINCKETIGEWKHE